MDKKVSELNKSIELFENAKKVIADRKSEIILETESVKNDIKYSVDVGNYLLKNKINGIIPNEEAIRRDIVDKGFSNNIRIPIIGGYNLAIRLYLHVFSYHICIIVYSDKGDIRNKLKKFKNEIKEKIGKLGNFDAGEDEGEIDNVYFVEIDTTKKDDCPYPEVTAKKIIELYDFLKEKIVQ